jgi:DNA-binding CsgD family transcriptional regulator
MSHYSIERFIEDTNRAGSSEETSRIFGSALESFGYDRFCYSLITAHRSAGLDAGHGIARNYPDDWMSYYESNDYRQKDPVPLHGLTTSKPFTWESVVKSRALSSEQIKIMNEAKEARLLDGIAIPICGHNGELAGVGIASSTGGTQPDRNLLGKIRALSYQFHLCYTELESKENQKLRNPPQCTVLTAREKEILLWAAEGKSDSVIADIIGVSHSTIRFHMKNIFKKLNANERTLATVKAIRLGLILPSYVG